MEPLDRLGALHDPVRRAAYRAVVESLTQPVGRDDVAAALGIGRTLAAFHLDKLVDVGLLTVTRARRSGRSGPGAGRPAKLYQRAADEHAVSLPPRDYETAAELLAAALDRSGADAALYDVARRAGARQAGADVIAALRERGYEPVPDGDRVRLGNCPFHHLAQQFPGLVCGMNLALIEGLVANADEWRCAIEPQGHNCCVVLSKTNAG